MWTLSKDNYCMYLRLLSESGMRQVPFLESGDSEKEHGWPRAIKSCPECWSESTQSRQSQCEIPWIPSAPLYNKRRIGWEDAVLEARYLIAKTAELQVFNQMRTASGMMLYISGDRPGVLLSVVRVKAS